MMKYPQQDGLNVEFCTEPVVLGDCTFHNSFWFCLRKSIFMLRLDWRQNLLAWYHDVARSRVFWGCCLVESHVYFSAQGDMTSSRIM